MRGTPRWRREDLEMMFIIRKGRDNVQRILGRNSRAHIHVAMGGPLHPNHFLGPRG